MSQSEEREPAPTRELRRCLCPACGSRDVWKWGKPTLTDRLIHTMFNRSPLTCRRCGHKFHRKVIFGHNG